MLADDLNRNAHSKSVLSITIMRSVREITLLIAVLAHMTCRNEYRKTRIAS